MDDTRVSCLLQGACDGLECSDNPEGLLRLLRPSTPVSTGYSEPTGAIHVGRVPSSTPVSSAMSLVRLA